MKFFSRKKQVSVIQQEQSVDVVNVDAFLDEHIKPFLKQAGFAKYGRTFYRKREDIFDVINFQGSRSNGFGNQKFYINCGMGSFTFQKEITGQEQPKPKYYRELYRGRIESFTGYYGSEFTLEDNYQAVDMSAFGIEVTNELQKLLNFFAKATSLNDLFDLCINRGGLEDHEEICYYLAKHHDKERLERHIRGLHDKMANGKLKALDDKLNKKLDQLGTSMFPRRSVDRWPWFADRMYAVIGEYQKDKIIAGLLKERAPANHPETKFKIPMEL